MLTPSAPKGVADAPDGVDEARALRKPQFLAQVGDVHLDDVWIDLMISAPHSLEDLLASEDLAGMLQ